MRIAIRGYKTIGEVQKAINKDEVEIVYIIDLNSNLWGEKIENIPVISPMKAFECMQKRQFEKIMINPFLGINKITDVINEMIELGFPIDSIRIPKTEDMYRKRCISQCDINTKKYSYENFKNIYYLEYHIADECNLNCASCSHFSPLVKDIYYPDLREIEREMKRLRELIDYIEWIRILGGEPFLNKEWKQYLKITRQVWPYSKISIVTNGLLLKSITEDDWNFIINNEIWIDISLYRPLWNKIDEIIIMLKKRGVKYEVNGTPVFKFTSIFDLKSEDDFREKRYECNAPCNNLYKGKMAPCPIMMYTSIFNKYFDQHLPIEQPVDLYDEQLNYKILVEQLKKPMPICRYCNMKEHKQWKQVDKECKIEDWIVMRD